jgi:hypothetical protein
MDETIMVDRRRNSSDHRLQELEAKIACLEGKVDKMMTTTSSIFEIIAHARGFFTVLGVVGNVLKWAAGIVVVVGGAWAVWSGKNGG